jgi:hypothetical protein
MCKRGKRHKDKKKDTRTRKANMDKKKDTRTNKRTIRDSARHAGAHDDLQLAVAVEVRERGR